MLAAWLIFIFVLGACVGSFLNVCICRLPYEKSIFWPSSSHCGRCYQPVRWYDNIPLLTYWLLRGRCRTCGAHFSPRYFFVELLTGLCFVGLFYLEVVLDVHHFSVFERERAAIKDGLIPSAAWIVFGYHAVLLCFLLVASFIDLEHFEIPLTITTTGTIVGLVGAVLLPWPWPNPITLGAATKQTPFGLYPWPFWHPLPSGFAPGGNWQTGLATGLAGVLVGTMLLRAVRFIFGVGRGKEGLGVGDADLMMMAGSFLGWQPVVVAFFLSVFPALLVGLFQLVMRGDQELAYGPSLSLGILFTMLGWTWIAPRVELVFFDSLALTLIVGMGAVFLLTASFILRLIRGPDHPTAA